MDCNSNQEDKFYLPKINDKIYQEIKSFKNFEFKNNIAFEALIRTNAYQDLRNMEYSERIIAAKKLGFNESDAKYAGLPWIIFKILREDIYYDKKGHALEFTKQFRLLIQKYSKEEKLTEPINCFEKICTYYILEETYPLNEILEFYTIEDMHFLQIIIDCFYEIFFNFLYKHDDMHKYHNDIKNSFNSLILSCLETSTYTFEGTVAENVLNGYRNSNLYILEHIHNGIDKLFTFYCQTEKVFTYTGEKVQDINKNIILENLDKCLFILVSNSNDSKQAYILLLCESKLSFGNINEATKASLIVNDITKFKFRDYNQVDLVTTFDTNILLGHIDDFVSQLNQSDIKKNKEIINLTFKRPLLTFHENNLAMIKVDMNLPYKDFMDFMENIKNEYDKNNNILKNTLELMHETIKNSDAHKTKNNIGDAFFCYDYYHMRIEHTISINDDIKDKNKNDINIKGLKDEIVQISRNDLYLKKEKNEQILALENRIKKESRCLKKNPALLKNNSNFVFNEEKFQESHIQSDTALRYYYKIAPYIKENQYSNIIIDFK
jgi:hypothetical protein